MRSVAKDMRCCTGQGHDRKQMSRRVEPVAAPQKGPRLQHVLAVGVSPYANCVPVLQARYKKVLHKNDHWMVWYLLRPEIPNEYAIAAASKWGFTTDLNYIQPFHLWVRSEDPGHYNLTRKDTLARYPFTLKEDTRSVRTFGNSNPTEVYVENLMNQQTVPNGVMLIWKFQDDDDNRKKLEFAKGVVEAKYVPNKRYLEQWESKSAANRVFKYEFEVIDATSTPDNEAMYSKIECDLVPRTK